MHVENLLFEVGGFILLLANVLSDRQQIPFRHAKWILSFKDFLSLETQKKNIWRYYFYIF